MDEWRNAIATLSDGGMLVAADAMEESSVEENQNFGRLLRRYVDIQTYVRMSQPIPLEMATEFEALNAGWKIEPRLYLGSNYQNVYSNQFGPFYMHLSAEMSELGRHLDWLEDQPIRELHIRNCTPGEDLKRIFRNHRMVSMKRLILNFGRGTRDANGVADTIRQMKGESLLSLSIQWGVVDRHKQVNTAFQLNRSFNRGAVLTIGATREVKR